MISVTAVKTYGAGGATTVRARVSAPTLERALERAGEGARVLLPAGNWIVVGKAEPVGEPVARQMAERAVAA